MELHIKERCADGERTFELKYFEAEFVGFAPELYRRFQYHMVGLVEIFEYMNKQTLAKTKRIEQTHVTVDAEIVEE